MARARSPAGLSPAGGVALRMRKKTAAPAISRKGRTLRDSSTIASGRVSTSTSSSSGGSRRSGPENKSSAKARRSQTRGIQGSAHVSDPQAAAQAGQRAGGERPDPVFGQVVKQQRQRRRIEYEVACLHRRDGVGEVARPRHIEPGLVHFIEQPLIEGDNRGCRAVVPT